MPGPDDKRFDWLYVKDDDERRKLWQRVYRMKPVRIPTCAMHWAAEQRCTHHICEFGPGVHYAFMDHINCYHDQHGERVLIYQPYHVDAGYLEKVCERLGLTYDINGLGWYGYGTVTVELRSNASISRNMERRKRELNRTIDNRLRMSGSP